MKKKILLLVFPAVALILEVLPYGAVMCHFNPKGRPFRETYSYFDMVPFGNANFGPLLTGILTCVLLILAILALRKDKWVRPLRAVALLALGTSLMPFVLSLQNYSLVGAGISLMLLAEWTLARKLDAVPGENPAGDVDKKE